MLNVYCTVGGGLLFLINVILVKHKLTKNNFLSSSVGYLIMTDDWFSEYVYEVVVDKKFLPPDVLEVMQQEPIVLPAWDPMGALA